MSPPQPTSEVRVLVAGYLEECIGDLIAEIIRKQLGYDHVTLCTILDLPTFLEAAAQSQPEVDLL